MKFLCRSDKCSGGGKQPETTHSSQVVSVNTQWEQLPCNRSPLSETRSARPQKPLSKRFRGSWERAHGRPVEHRHLLPRLVAHNKRKLRRFITHCDQSEGLYKERALLEQTRTVCCAHINELRDQYGFKTGREKNYFMYNTLHQGVCLWNA